MYNVEGRQWFHILFRWLLGLRVSIVYIVRKCKPTEFGKWLWKNKYFPSRVIHKLLRALKKEQKRSFLGLDTHRKLIGCRFNVLVFQVPVSFQTICLQWGNSRIWNSSERGLLASTTSKCDSTSPGCLPHALWFPMQAAVHVSCMWKAVMTAGSEVKYS